MNKTELLTRIRHLSRSVGILSKVRMLATAHKVEAKRTERAELSGKGLEAIVARHSVFRR
jgi:hypothetical protein